MGFPEEAAQIPILTQNLPFSTACEFLTSLIYARWWKLPVAG